MSMFITYSHTSNQARHCIRCANITTTGATKIPEFNVAVSQENPVRCHTGAINQFSPPLIPGFPMRHLRQIQISFSSVLSIKITNSSKPTYFHDLLCPILRTSKKNQIKLVYSHIRLGNQSVTAGTKTTRSTLAVSAQIKGMTPL